MPPKKPKKPATPKSIETLIHDDATRKNIPTAEYQSLVHDRDKAPIPVTYPRQGAGLEEEKQQRNPDRDPQLIWRGKDQQDWSDLVVQAPPLYIQEKIHPKVLIDDLRRQTQASQPATPEEQIDLFGDFNGLPETPDAKTEFYQHEGHWSNRMILGDSLQVMASLAEREGLRGKVQCIYFDPPYGIKFNSNFQWSTNNRDVKDGKADNITREPEQVKAFRDTWKDGIHSYLTYLRDRLTVARDLLTDSGSIFVQIGDENLHFVTALLGEVFEHKNLVSIITFRKTNKALGANLLGGVTDYIIWYAKNKETIKYRKLKETKNPADNPSSFKWCAENGIKRSTSETDRSALKLNPNISFFTPVPLTSSGYTESCTFSFEYNGRSFQSGSRKSWATTKNGVETLKKADRLFIMGNTPFWVQYFEDLSTIDLDNVWHDTRGELAKSYVVQTTSKVIERCILMTTDPGDLVLDPTMGSGTTAYVAEQWGRRWITIDTSRVATALARARIMGARYPYYLLADSPEGKQKEAELRGSAQWSVDSGQEKRKKDGELATSHSSPATASTLSTASIRHGFVYERVPHITLKSIANNTEIDVIWEQFEQHLKPLREQLSVASGQKQTLEEWEIPRERPEDWTPETEPLLAAFWSERIARQKAIDASIAARADVEFLYDKPYEDKKKVRVAGPFTVESLSPHRMLTVDENDNPVDTVAENLEKYGAVAQTFDQMILENLRMAGVQQAHKADKINFTSLNPWPGDLICAEGRYETVASTQGIVDGGNVNTLSTNNYPQSTDFASGEVRAAIFIGPEYGTITRVQLVDAAKEAGDAGFDVLIACGFAYEAHTTDFSKLGKIQVLKARMNADLHMATDLKNTGKGNLFVIFGEPDITVASEEWIVDSSERKIAPYEIFKLVSGTDSLEQINGLNRADIQSYASVSLRREVWDYLTDAACRLVGASEHSRGASKKNDRGISAVAWHCAGFTGGTGNFYNALRKAGVPGSGEFKKLVERLRGDKQNAARADGSTFASPVENLHFPLTTVHYTQTTVLGVDIFKPSTGEVVSTDAADIACWFVDTNYNEESFFVRQAYFLGANDPYKSLKTTLKAEIDLDAWESLHSDTSRPFSKPETGKIAVKVINHLGDEVMKVFRV